LRVIGDLPIKQQINSYSRRFERLNELLSSLGLKLVGNLTQRIGHLSFIKISASTILRLIIKCPIQAIEPPKIIGVDDWAFKKHFNYGTIIIDLKRIK
jgi:transposase